MLLQIDITNKCNLNCKHCRAEKDLKELNLPDIKKICKNAKRNNFKEIALSGGEPTIHKDFLNILKIINNYGFICDLTTNGVYMREKFLEDDEFKKIRNIQISIDGTEEIHDRIRGMRGAFKKSIENAKQLKKKGFNVFIKSVISQSNYDSIISLAKYLSKEGLDYFEVRMLIPCSKGREEWEKEKIDPKSYKKLFQDLRKIKNLKVLSSDPVLIPSVPELMKAIKKEELNSNEKIYGGCRAGLDQLYISSNRGVYPCSYLPIKLGNINDDFLEIMNSKQFKKISNREKLKGKCGKCKNKYLCGGCRAYPYLLDNDLMGEDIHCPED